MTIVYSVYLFDAAGFHQEMQPIVPALDTGEYQSLYWLGKSTMEKHPELWPLLDEFFLGPPFEEPGEQPSRQRLVMMVMSRFLQPVRGFQPNGGWEVLESALRLIGWSRDDARRLLHGDSVCTLLRPEVPYRPEEYLRRLQERPWCAVSADWLDLQSIDQFAEHLDQTRAAYDTLAKEPGAIMPHLGWDLASDERVSQWTSIWNTETVTRLYEDEARILATASQARTALAISLIS